MTNKKNRKVLTLEIARDLFRYENGKLYWKNPGNYTKRSVGDIVGTTNRFSPKVIIKGKGYPLNRIVYLLHHGYYPNKIEFIDKRLTAEGMYDLSIENLYEPTKKVHLKKSKMKLRKELSYSEANEYLEYKNGRLYWKAKPYPTNSIVVGNLIGGTSGTSYLKVTLHKKTYHQHRIVYLLHHGFCPDVVTFINKTLTHEGFYDISIENLKAMSYSQLKTSLNTRVRGSSKYRGVYYDKQEKVFRVRVSVNGIRKTYGNYDNEITAARRYDEVARQLIGEDAALNFPN